MQKTTPMEKKVITMFIFSGDTLNKHPCQEVWGLVFTSTVICFYILIHTYILTILQLSIKITIIYC